MPLTPEEMQQELDNALAYTTRWDSSRNLERIAQALLQLSAELEEARKEVERLKEYE